jgi:hypothetical protein
LHEDVISHEERDAMIRAALAEHGDTGVTPRHTLFSSTARATTTT